MSEFKKGDPVTVTGPANLDRRGFSGKIVAIDQDDNDVILVAFDCDYILPSWHHRANLSRTTG